MKNMKYDHPLECSFIQTFDPIAREILLCRKFVMDQRTQEEKF